MILVPKSLEFDPHEFCENTDDNLWCPDVVDATHWFLLPYSMELQKHSWTFSTYGSDADVILEPDTKTHVREFVKDARLWLATLDQFEVKWEVLWGVASYMQ